MSLIHAELRGPGLLGNEARHQYRGLRLGQPLIPQREPTNEKDPNAVIALSSMCQPVAYVSKEHAAIISPLMRQGRLYLITVMGTGSAFKHPQIWIQKAYSQIADITLDPALVLSSWGFHESVIRAYLSGKYNLP